MRDYLNHFGLKDAPFSKEIPDSELWMPPSKQALVDELVEAIHERHSVALTGEPGIGKTCVLRALRNSLDSAVFRFTYCHNVTISRRDFYRHLCCALGLPRSYHNAGDLFAAVSSCVQDLAREHLFPVFLIDEAHLLHQDTLDHLHILCNFDWDSKPLLSLILVGLPELEERLRLRRNRSLYSRIHSRLSISSLEPDDTADYIRMRLHRAGCDRELFSSDALAMIHEAAAGSLRDIDRIATGSLRAGSRKKRKLIERDIVTRVCQSEGVHRP